jgi:predicted nucleotidyltransferase
MVWIRERPQISLTRRMQMSRSAVLERSFGSVKVFWLDKEYIQRQLMIAVDALKGDGNVLKIILFGSFAEGRAVPGSDVDVLIVLRSDPRRFIDRIPDYLEIFSDLGTGVDVFPYTVDELENPVARNAVATGKVLLERGS